MKLKIKKKDKVIVISGKEKGKTGEVLELIAGDAWTQPRVLIAKINLVTKHKKPTQTDPGGLSKIEASIPLCNVMLVDPKSGKPTRSRVKIAANGDKTRVAVKSGETIA
ncbi:MAG: 50S ribosomal protein L24 [Elusimicrobiota bacterium]|nr:MAG: 50S ribosomal protein L24 [Elusimicrobiota bacterium]